MGYDIRKFAKKFQDTIAWMMEDKYSNRIKETLQLIIENKCDLRKNPNSPEALREVVELIVTQGRRLSKPKGFDKYMNSFIEKYGDKFMTEKKEEAKDKLENLVGDKRKEKISKLFEEYSSMRDFTKKLYQLAKKGKTDVLGEKGRDNYLRDFGYWDRVPIDIHEMRFILRSGIFHACSDEKKRDPQKKAHFQHVLTRFCREHLKGFKVKIQKKDGSPLEICLEKKPGIVDIFIWSYCAEDRYNICGKEPKCSECLLNGECLYAITNTSIKKNRNS